ncbi:MAG: Linocin_M18 bacteriocin protein [Lachnoclostridium sp.]|jgi:uncharacterized linocin/CFP29 family protein
MSYLSRENSNLPDELWNQIDQTVVQTARNVLVGRRFLHLFGPLGIGVESIHIDDAKNLDEVPEDGFITTKGRKYVEIPTIYDDFTILAKDLEYSRKFGYPVDLSKVSISAENCARKEDHFIFFGNTAHEYEGLINAAGTNKLKRSDWSEGENAFSDIAKGLEIFASKGIYGTYALVLSPDLYLQLQRIQPGTGLLEIDRINKLLNNKVYYSTVLGTNKAVLLCPETRNMDLVIGQDLATAYLEQKDLNHSFRILETILLRIKRRDAITVFE